MSNKSEHQVMMITAALSRNNYSRSFMLIVLHLFLGHGTLTEMKAVWEKMYS